MLCCVVLLSQGPVTLEQDGTQDAIILFNSLAETRTQLVSVVMPASMQQTNAPPTIVDATGNAIVSQLDVDGKTIHFIATIPSVGLATYFFVANGPKPAVQPVVTQGAASEISNANIALQFNTGSGELTGIVNKADGSVVAVRAYLAEYYDSSGGPYCKWKKKKKRKRKNELFLLCCC
jgi:hypothetical protein